MYYREGKSTHQDKEVGRLWYTVSTGFNRLHIPHNKDMNDGIHNQHKKYLTKGKIIIYRYGFMKVVPLNSCACER